MHTDARTLDNNTQLQADICIAGAGAAGISLALELAKSNQQVILLESGGFKYEEETSKLNAGHDRGHPYYPLRNTRMRYFGGTTNHWAGFCAPLDPIDFEERSWVPHSGWPFDKTHLDPFYERAQTTCELGPYNYSPSFWAEKMSRQPMPLNPTRVQTKMWQKSLPTRFGTRYRDDILNAANIHLFTYANLTEIELDAGGQQVTGFKLKTLEGKSHRVKAKHYVMACGTVQNTRYMLASNAVIKQGVGNQNDLVGRFFMEHPHLETANMMLANNHNMDFYFEDFGTSSPFGMLALAPKEQRLKKLLNYSAQLQPSKLGNLPEDVKDLIQDSEASIQEGIAFDKALDEAVKAGNKPEMPDTTYFRFSTRIEQSPNPDSRVTLSDTLDKLGTPEPNINWQLTELDKKTIREANLIIGKELGITGLGRLHLPDWLFTPDSQWPDYLWAGFHHMGTLRMHNDAQQGVVDKNCKVHGLPNLFIAGSGVFPTGGVANPTLTIVALAIRLADHLQGLG